MLFTDHCDSGDILQHISHSSRGNLTSTRVGTSRQDEASYGSEVHDFALPATTADPDTLDTIESELDVLKREVTALRQEEYPTPQTHTTHHPEEFPKLPTSHHGKTSVPDEEPVESNAARMKARYEQAQRDKLAALAREKEERENATPELPPGLDEFPGLGTPTSSLSSQKKPMGVSGVRKTSYASAASSGMKDALNKSFPSKRSNIRSDAVSTVSGSKTSRGSTGSLNSPQPTVASLRAGKDQQSLPEGDNSVIISPPTAQPGTSPGQESKPTASVGKQAPRFAQATKATARRADETLRKESTTSVAKASPDGSPNKSFRTLSQRQQKRQPLPGAWTGSPEISPTKQSFAAASPSSRSQVIDFSSSQEKKLVFPTTAKASPEQGLRKKTSSYMSPTKATTLRNIETLGQENIKQVSPRLSKRVETHVSPVKTMTSPIEDTPPLSGSTLASESITSSGFQPHSITDRVLQHLMTGKPSAMRDASSATPEVFGSRAASSTNASTFGSPMPQTSNPSRRSTVSSPFDQTIAAAVKADEFPEVANTTIKRRGSQGQILAPIIKRLDKEGLLRSQPSVAEESEEAVQATPLMSTMATVQQNFPIPPPGLQPTANVLAHQVPVSQGYSAQSIAQAPTVNMIAAALRQPQSSSTGSLRATAQEFKPTWQPQPVQEQVSRLDWQGMLDYRPSHEWYDLPMPLRDAIVKVRRSKAGGSLSPVRRAYDTFPSIPSQENSREFVLDTANWDPTMAQNLSDVNTGPESNYQPPASPPKFVAKSVPKPYTIEAGAVLKPELDPNTNTIQWVRQTDDGNKELVHFGRAPPPDNTPSISPSSVDTSPARFPFTPSPGNARRWRIDSLMNNKYGWKGGDGREISFIGSGANAERDPNPPTDVNFGYQGHGNPSFGISARLVGPDEDGSDSPPLAPRSREQWAKLAGLPRVPCSEFNVKAAEMIPRPSIYEGQDMGPFGYCRPCYPNRN